MLLFIDNIFRFTQAGSEVSALLGRIPSAPSATSRRSSTEMGELQERITSTNKGSITSVQAIYVPADDLTDPAPATAFAHLDATTVLSRAIAELGIYPAVDPLDSTSTHPRPAASSARSTTRSRAQVQQMLQRYKDLQDIIAILGMDELSRGRQAHRRRARARSSASSRSRSSSPRRSPARTGKYVELEDTDPRLRGDPRRQARRPARAGVLHGRRHRRRARAAPRRCRRRTRKPPCACRSPRRAARWSTPTSTR